MKLLLLGHGIANDGVAKLLEQYHYPYDYLEIDQVKDHYGIIVKSPGIPFYDPFIVKAIAQNSCIISDIELVYWLSHKMLIGITGSNGKTTTTTLVNELVNQVRKSVACGNIGYAVGQAVVENPECDTYVVELSSFQLKGTKLFSPEIAVLLNVTPSHLDYHETFHDYIAAKQKIFRNQHEDKLLIYSKDDPTVVEMVSQAISKTRSFSIKNHIADAYLVEDWIYLNQEPYVSLSELSLGLRYATECVLASILVADELQIPKETVLKVLKEFQQVPYRLQEIKPNIFNDAKSTNPYSTIHAIQQFQIPIYLICGGYDRKESLEILDGHLTHIKKILAYGASKQKIFEYCQIKKIPIELFDTLEETVSRGLELKSEQDILLYSPMFASYDQFQSYTERGALFQKLILGN